MTSLGGRSPPNDLATQLVSCKLRFLWLREIRPELIQKLRNAAKKSKPELGQKFRFPGLRTIIVQADFVPLCLYDLVSV